jgi:putative lipoic acid-binding regulatory protein
MPSQGWTHSVVIQQSSKATWLAISCSIYAKDDEPVTFDFDE